MVYIGFSILPKLYSVCAYKMSIRCHFINVNTTKLLSGYGFKVIIFSIYGLPSCHDLSETSIVKRAQIVYALICICIPPAYDISILIKSIPLYSPVIFTCLPAVNSSFTTD